MTVKPLRKGKLMEYSTAQELLKAHQVKNRAELLSHGLKESKQNTPKCKIIAVIRD